MTRATARASLARAGDPARARGKAWFHRERAGSRPRRAGRDRKRVARQGKRAKRGSVECRVPLEKSRAPMKKSRVPTKKSHARHGGVSSVALPAPRSARKMWWLALQGVARGTLEPKLSLTPFPGLAGLYLPYATKCIGPTVSGISRVSEKNMTSAPL